VVRAFERDNLKGYGLFSVVFLTTEGNLEGDGPEGLGLVTRNHPIKGDRAMVELGLVRLSFVKVSMYIMFRLLPPSIKHLENS
jgi:hypothetical protein